MAISLEKRAEKVGIVLAKRGITKVPTVRVGAALDVSGSARGFYSSGQMQETVDRLMGVAMQFDDNGELDMWAFSDTAVMMEGATVEDAGHYINDKMMADANVQRHLWSGTSYAPVLESVIDHYFPKKSSNFFSFLTGNKKTDTNDMPAFLLFITDGANDDRVATARVLKEAAGKPVYFMMIGLGDPHSFSFIKEQADLLPNVGFVNLNSLTMTDDDLYEELVSGEFADWVKQYV